MIKAPGNVQKARTASTTKKQTTNRRAEDKRRYQRVGPLATSTKGSPRIKNQSIYQTHSRWASRLTLLKKNARRLMPCAATTRQAMPAAFRRHCERSAWRAPSENFSQANAKLVSAPTADTIKTIAAITRYLRRLPPMEAITATASWLASHCRNYKTD